MALASFRKRCLCGEGFLFDAISGGCEASCRLRLPGRVTGLTIWTFCLRSRFSPLPLTPAGRYFSFRHVLTICIFLFLGAARGCASCFGCNGASFGTLASRSLRRIFAVEATPVGCHFSLFSKPFSPDFFDRTIFFSRRPASEHPLPAAVQFQWFRIHGLRAPMPRNETHSPVSRSLPGLNPGRATNRS